MGEKTDDAVYILDSYGLIYRAYYALINHPLTNSNGENIGAVSIFFRNLKALISKYGPKYLVAAFDSRVPTFRHKMYDQYKANRQKTPDDLHAQVPWIEDVLGKLGVPVLRVDGFEADDIIATVARRCSEEKLECRILSGDKDLLQLVTDTCKEMQPDKANGGWETVGIDQVKEKWGVPPETILDFLSLLGDASDNVPGVAGVGEKTALKLLLQYGSMDEIYAHADEIKGALGNKIRAGKDDAYFSRKLITLDSHVDVEIDFDSFRTDNLDYAAAGKRLEELGAYSVAKSYSASSTGSSEKDGKSKPAASKKGDLPEEDSQLPEVRKNSGNYRPVTDPKDLSSIIDSILSSDSKSVAFDTETDGLDSLKASLVGFSLCSKKGEAVYVPVILPGGMFAPETVSKDECIRQLARLFDCPNVTVIMHNGKFDLHVLCGNGYSGIPSCKIVDTMVAAWILDPDALGKSPYGLEYLAETKLGLKGIEFSDIVAKDRTFADVPLETAYPYGAEDADFTWQLWSIFGPRLTESGLDGLFSEMEMKVMPVLARMERSGIHLDRSALDSYGVELKKHIADLEGKIYAEAGHEFNIASTKQLQTVLFEERHLVPGKKTKTGYSTDTAVLEELSERTSDPLPKAILDYRGATKLLNTYVETLPSLVDGEGRVHTTFLQTGTATGRLSSKDPNLQNIPVRDDAGRRIRSAFTSVPGTILISADYSQIELVVLAHLSGDKNLCGAFIDGVDVHRSTAALIYGLEPDRVTPDMRRFAKTVNFGVMYGMSAFRLAAELGISRTEAKNFIDQYFATYSGVKKFLGDTVASAQEKGFVETIMGRRRVIRGINSSNKLEQNAAQRVAVNTPIQGSAADIVKKAMVEIQSSIDSDEMLRGKLKPLLQVHDELIFECPEDPECVEKALSMIRDRMENAVKLSVPLRVSIEHGKNWGEFH